MKYILVANNKAIDKTFYKSIENTNDIILTFNHGWPLFNTQLLLQNNQIYHFCRRSFNRKIPYSGLVYINKIKHRLQKIFLYPHPESIGNKEQKNKVFKYIKEHTSLKIKEIQHMHNFGKNPNTQKTKQFLKSIYNNVSNMSMGLIGYLYIQQIKKDEDGVFIYGFSHQMNKKKPQPTRRKRFL